MKRQFLINGFWLTATTLIARTMGMFFRVYMSNSIGAEAIGLYQLILTVFFFAVTFSTTGVSLLVTRLVTEAIAKDEQAKVKYIIKRCMAISVNLSLIAAVALYWFAQPIGENLLGDSRTTLALKVLAPGLPFMAVSACFRGYFYARRTVLKTASEQLLEQIVEIGLFAVLVTTMAPMGIEYACCAVAIGTTVAEVVSFGYSLLLYKLDIKKQRLKEEKMQGFWKKAVQIALPVTVSACLRAGLSTIENMLIPVGLKKSGSSYEKSLADYGSITGMVMPVITFPSVFLYSFSMLMIPEVSQAYSTLRKKSIQYMTTRVLRFIFLFSIPTAVVFFFFAGDLGMMIYGSKDIGIYMCLLAPIVPLMYLDGVVDGLLKGLNEQMHYLSYNLIDSVVKVVLIIILLPKMGIMGLIIVMYVSTVLNTGLSLLRLLKVTEIHIKFFDWIVKPLTAALLPCVSLRAISAWLSWQPGIYIVGEIIMVVLLYIIFIWITGTLKQEEISWVKSIFEREPSKSITKKKKSVL